MYWIISQVKGLAFPVQYRAAKVGPPVRYQSKICGYWCVLAVLYCRSSPALLFTCMTRGSGKERCAEVRTTRCGERSLLLPLGREEVCQSWIGKDVVGSFSRRNLRELQGGHCTCECQTSAVARK